MAAWSRGVVTAQLRPVLVGRCNWMSRSSLKPKTNHKTIADSETHWEITVTLGVKLRSDALTGRGRLRVSKLRCLKGSNFSYWFHLLQYGAHRLLSVKICRFSAKGL